MFTPIGFFAGTAVLPPLVTEASVYYSADQNTDWTDLTTNGNDGTVGTLGSGGGAAIDHVAGATPYWQFKAPNPLTEQKFLDTNYAKTVSGDYSVMLVISFSDVTTNNIQGVGGLATPSGNASFNIGQNTTQRFYHGNKGANVADNLFTYGDTILSTDTFYMVTVVGDSSGIYLYNNNILDGSDTSNGTTYASSETFVLGRDISLTANYVNNQKVAAYAFFDGVALNATQRTELFDYYDEIYSIWSPKDIANAQYWWTADAGVTTSTGGVSVWTDQINSLTLEQSDSADRPSYGVSSNMNGQNTVTFNGTTDFLYGPSLPANLNGSDLTILVSYYLPNTTPGDGVVFGHQYVGTAQGRIWFDGFDDTIRFVDAFGSNTSGGNTVHTMQDPIVAGKKFSKMRYDSSNGSVYFAQDTLTETTTRASGYAGQEWSQLAVLQMGAMLDSLASPTPSLGRYIEMEVTDVVVIYGTPTTEEMNRWATYIERKYGTVLS